MCQNAAPPAAQPAASVLDDYATPLPGHACGCGGRAAEAHARSAVGRLVPAAHELDLPPVPFPSPRVLGTVGAARLRSLVRHHHKLLRDSEIGHLFAADDSAFGKLVGHIADYVVEACGGPAAFTEARGEACMRTRHFPFAIDERGREVWLEKLCHALIDNGFPLDIRQEYWNWLEPFSIRMINRRTTKGQPLRLSWQEAVQRFTPALVACDAPA